MATMTLTNLLGNNATSFSKNSVSVSYDASENHFDTSKSYSVTAGHRYYARATATCPSASTNKSTGTRAIFSSMSGADYIAGAASSPSAGINNTNSTDHAIFTIPSGVTKINPGLMWSASAGAGGGTHTVKFLLLIDITALETAVGFQYNANTFWDNVLNSTLFTTTKSITYTPASNSWNLMDSNGTTIYQINKVYDNNGTTNYEIGKIYDNDGTSSHLIYIAEENILSKFSASDYYHPNGAYQAASINSDGSLQFNATSYICRNIWTPAIDLSQYNNLQITYSVTASTKPAGTNAVRRFYIMANSSNTFSGDFNNRSDMYGGNVTAPGTTYYQLYQSGYADYYGQSYYVEPNLDAGTTYTKTIDISSWTGSKKIGLGALCGSSNTLTIKVTSIILS